MAKKSKLSAGIVAAASAGAYFLLSSKDAQKNRKKFKGWVIKAKGEVIDKIEDMKEVNEEKYNKLIDSTVKKYKKLKKAEKKEIDLLQKDLLKHWKNIKRELKESDLLSAEPAKPRRERSVKKN